MTRRIARLRWLLVLFAGAALAAEEGRQVAITIDDLPRGGDAGPDDLSGIRAMTQDLMRPLEILKLWLDAGAQLGNHSYSHPDINSVARLSSCASHARQRRLRLRGRVPSARAAIARAARVRAVHGIDRRILRAAVGGSVRARDSADPVDPCERHQRRAYRSPDEYAGRNGFSWIHRWSKTKGLAEKGEPDPPEWVTKAFENRR